MKDFRKFCRPKLKTHLSAGDFLLRLKCGTTGAMSPKEYKKVKKFFKSDSFVGESSSSAGKVITTNKMTGDIAIFDIETYNLVKDLFEILEIVGEKLVDIANDHAAQEGDIICYNSELDREVIFSYEDWITLDDSWDAIGLYGITTIEEENTVGGEYVIMADGITFIINSSDYSKVSSQWEHVDTIASQYDYAGHDYVDLGLPSGTKWATMNVGASSETDYGNYYQYGKGAVQYAATSGDSNYSGTEDPLAASADTAVQVWGGSWHMPTRAQMQELTANTTYQWVTNYKGSGINGGTFTATNGAVLFIPAAGYWYDGSQLSVGENGSYWSSSTNGSLTAYYLYFLDGSKFVYDDDRKYGYSVRPVVG